VGGMGRRRRRRGHVNTEDGTVEEAAVDLSAGGGGWGSRVETGGRMGHRADREGVEMPRGWERERN